MEEIIDKNPDINIEEIICFVKSPDDGKMQSELDDKPDVNMEQKAYLVSETEDFSDVDEQTVLENDSPEERNKIFNGIKKALKKS